MPSQDEGELLVIRFSPFTAEGLWRNAQGTYRDDEKHGRPPRWGVSVYAGVRAQDESVDDLIVRVCRDAPVSGKKINAVPSESLVSAGFQVIVDEPPSHHWLVLLQNGHPEADAVALSGLLDRGRRQNPGWTGR